MERSSQNSEIILRVMTTYGVRIDNTLKKRFINQSEP